MHKVQKHNKAVICHTMARTEKSPHKAPLGPVLLTDRMTAALSLIDTAARGSTATGWENLQHASSAPEQAGVRLPSMCSHDRRQCPMNAATAPDGNVCQDACRTGGCSNDCPVGRGPWVSRLWRRPVLQQREAGIGGAWQVRLPHRAQLSAKQQQRGCICLHI